MELGIHHVKCSYTLTAYGMSSSMEYYNGILHKNNNEVLESFTPMTFLTSDIGVSSCSCILDVNENDVIRLYIRARKAGNITCFTNSLMIEVID